jgi:hypothetical protein
VTSGTTVRALQPYLALDCVQAAIRSLKTARPLLASVAHFILHAVLLFPYVDPSHLGVPNLTQFKQGH